MMHTEEFEDYQEVISDGWITVAIKADITVGYSAFPDGRVERIEYLPKMDITEMEITEKSALLHYNDSIGLQRAIENMMRRKATAYGDPFHLQLEQMINERVEKREAAAA